MRQQQIWIQQAPVQQCIELGERMWQKGWAEGSAGNISYRLSQQEVVAWQLETGNVAQQDFPYPLPRPVATMAGEYLLITASGILLRKLRQQPEQGLGIIAINTTGTHYRIVCGLHQGRRPTSELITHLLLLEQRSVEETRTVLHAHATWLTIMSEILPAESEQVTKWLWRMCSESLAIFPDGVGVLPWMVPGSVEIGKASAVLAATHRLILWAFHGGLALGRDPDEAFSLLEIADKAAQIYCQRHSIQPSIEGISDSQLQQLAEALGINPYFTLC